jgi:hypothetical protein
VKREVRNSHLSLPSAIGTQVPAGVILLHKCRKNNHQKFKWLINRHKTPFVALLLLAFVAPQQLATLIGLACFLLCQRQQLVEEDCDATS